MRATPEIRHNGLVYGGITGPRVVESRRSTLPTRGRAAALRRWGCGTI